jgi:hypothetical protein
MDLYSFVRFTPFYYYDWQDRIAGKFYYLSTPREVNRDLLCIVICEKRVTKRSEKGKRRKAVKAFPINVLRAFFLPSSVLSRAEHEHRNRSAAE